MENLKRLVTTWGEIFSSSAIHTQTTALGEGIKTCTVGRNTTVTVTARDWQVNIVSHVAAKAPVPIRTLKLGCVQAQKSGFSS